MRGASLELLGASLELLGASLELRGASLELLGGVGAVREDMDDERDKHRETFCFCQSVLRA